MKLTYLWSIAIALLTSGGISERVSEKPNILIILSDDLTYHDLGCYGNKDVKTPNIDQLATEGLRFKYCFNSSPMCAPTRMSLYTGIHPVRNGAYPNHSKVYDHIKSLPHYLGAEGYQVALLGKKHYKPAANFPFEYLGGRGHDNGDGSDLDLTKGKSFFERNQNTPWCLVLSSNQPHTPWNKGDTSLFQPKKLQIPPYLVDTDATRKALQHYYAEINYFDQQLGTILNYLQTSGQEENTLIIYLSEQGSNLPHAKWTCYDNGLRSAAIFKWKNKIKSNQTSPAMIQYVDVLPTLLDLIDPSIDLSNFDGKSFAQTLLNGHDQHHQYVYGVQTSKGIYHGPEAYGIRTIRDKRYRLIWNINAANSFSNTVTYRGGPQGVFTSWREKAAAGDALAQTYIEQYVRRPEWELYDLHQDPYELENIIASPKAKSIIEDLRPKLLDWMKQQGDMGDLTEWTAISRQSKKNKKTPLAPLFVDPNYQGSCDPEIIWNEHDQQWYIYYTARRPLLDNTWLQTPIGVAVSKDLINWNFKGYCHFNGVAGTKDAEATYWAPAMISSKGKLHMFVTYKPDTLPTKGAWGGPGKIVHYQADLTDPIKGWKKVADMHGADLNTIDATVYQSDGLFHLWFKGKEKGAKKNELYHLTSKDLYTWENKNFTKSDVFNVSVSGSGFEEAPYIFQWQNKHWLITDPHRGLFIYSSEDGDHWNFQGTILQEGGGRALDNNMARHCSVAILNNRAFIFYHVEPWRRYDLEQKKGKEKVRIFDQPLQNRRSVLQVAELKLIDGKLTCNRDEEITL